jgi:hypothetical protein
VPLGGSAHVVLLGDVREVGEHWMPRSMPHIRKGICPWCVPGGEPITRRVYLACASSVLAEQRDRQGYVERAGLAWAPRLLGLSVDAFTQLAGRDLAGLCVQVFRGTQAKGRLWVRLVDRPAPAIGVKPFRVADALWSLWGLTPELLRQLQARASGRPADPARLQVYRPESEVS